ncbi:MAG: hypothetical protein OXG04_16900 [Acidobacteria bacterium]|nr:hypothetical protein [Acidobacteriota bacterium]
MPAREKFSSQAAPELLAAMREIARSDGRRFQSVLEDAMTGYIETRARQEVRPEVMAHYRASVERNRLLAELLAK